MTTMLVFFKGILTSLDTNKIDYMVVGSVASMLYGEPRLTADMDVVVEIPLSSVPDFDKIFPSDRFYIPPIEIISQEVVNRRQFNILELASGLKVDFIVRRGDSHSIAEFARRRLITFLPGFDAFVAAPEDIIIKKLIYFREGRSQKHLADIRGIITQTKVDLAYLEYWVEELRLESFWAQVNA